MLYRLALTLGIANVEGPGGLTESISEWQFLQWIIYHSIEPFGPLREDLRAGVIVSNLVNVQRTSSTAKAFTPMDFFPTLKESMEKSKPIEPLKGESWKEFKRELMAYTKSQGQPAKLASPVFSEVP